MGVLGSTLYARSSTPSSMWSAAAVSGDCCPTTSHPGRPFTTTFASGVWMERGRGCTQPCARECGSASRGTLSPAQASSTVSRSKRPGWAEESEDTMEARRSKAENATCWSTRRVWCSKRGYTARDPRPGGHQAVARDRLVGSCAPAPLPPLDGRWLHRRRQGRRLGAEGIWMDG